MAETRGGKPGEGTDKTVWVAVYTRKSTDENLNGDFTSLDSQAEYCKAFLKTREPDGWRFYPQQYTDAGFSGGNMERPGLRKLIADARAGKFQVVVCYKYDRLTRNTRDFLSILDVFDKAGVHFVSVTQPIDTTSPVGRLMRSILMEFAQFEREMISERTRDKLSAMARKGKRTGGCLVLGYDRDQESKQVTINEEEAKAVRVIFDTYLKKRSLCAAAKLLESRGIRTKQYKAKNGKAKGGRRFDKVRLSYLLRNPFYIGKIRHRGELYAGEHKAILDAETFRKAQEALKQNAVRKNSTTRGHHDFLLKGLLRCGGCKTLMTPHYSRSPEGVEFFYYRCSSVNHMDKTACPTGRSVQAKSLEQFVIDRLRVLGQDPALVDEIIKAALCDADTDLPPKRREKAKLTAEMGKVEGDVRNLTSVLAREGPSTGHYRVIMEQLDQLAAKRDELRSSLVALENEILDLETRQVDAQVFRDNLANFVRVFEKMDAADRREMIRLVLLEAVYDRAQSELRLGLLPFQSFDWPLEERYGANLVDCNKTLPD
ncbi:MAG: recombinase family protein [Elusimicrobiota bacterium]